MKTTTKFKLGGGVVGAALLIAIPFTTDREGVSLAAYRDVVGVWTICNGETLGVKPGDRKTPEECAMLTHTRVGQYLSAVAAEITSPVTPKTLAAHADFAYNVGVTGYKSSQVLKLTNQGKVAQGCNAMFNWSGLTKKGVKYDCSRLQNVKAIDGCRGIMNRRTAEVALCLEGVTDE